MLPVILFFRAISVNWRTDRRSSPRGKSAGAQQIANTILGQFRLASCASACSGNTTMGTPAGGRQGRSAVLRHKSRGRGDDRITVHPALVIMFFCGLAERRVIVAGAVSQRVLMVMRPSSGHGYRSDPSQARAAYVIRARPVQEVASRPGQWSECARQQPMVPPVLFRVHPPATRDAAELNFQSRRKLVEQG